jgi:hypothetical protein
MKNSPVTIENIRGNSDLCELFGCFDVEIHVDGHFEENWYFIIGEKNYDSFGSDGAGGRYILLSDERILYITSEGAAGIVADSFSCFADLISGAPYWHDILHFSCHGKLQFMKQAEKICKANFDTEEDWPEDAVIKFRTIFGLGKRRESYAKELRDAVLSGMKNIQVKASVDGNVYGNLFGSFKPHDNPIWRHNGIA